jgi:hypothetical protein
MSINMEKLRRIRDRRVFDAVESPVGSDSPGEKYSVVLNDFHSRYVSPLLWSRSSLISSSDIKKTIARDLR